MAGSPFPRGPRHSLCSRRRRPEGRRAGGRAHTALGRAHVVNQMHHKWGTGWPGDGTHPVLCKDKGHLLLGRLPPQMTGALCTPHPERVGEGAGGLPALCRQWGRGRLPSQVPSASLGKPYLSREAGVCAVSSWSRCLCSPGAAVRWTPERPCGGSREQRQAAASPRAAQT